MVRYRTRNDDSRKKRERRHARKTDGLSLIIRKKILLSQGYIAHKRFELVDITRTQNIRKWAKWLSARGKSRRVLPGCPPPMGKSEALKEDDVVIALLGPTGSGKSTFIRSVSGLGASHVSDALGSCTNEIVPTRWWDPESGRNVVLLDTPGFNSAFQSGHNLDIFNDIFRWFESSYKKRKHISGILYFHRITDNRSPGTLLQYFRMFQKLLGEGCFRNVHLITTMWDVVETSIGEERFQELQKNDWKAIIGQGANIARFGNDSDSAKRIIQQILKDESFIALSKNDFGMNDIVIAVMGVTGSGKSSFIRSASGSTTQVQVTDTLRPAPTNEIVAVKCEEQQDGQCIVLLDTPGLGSSDYKLKTEWNVLRMISEWLNLRYHDTKRLSGILYLHRITDNRITGTPLETRIASLRKLLGRDCLDKVYLTTTMWDEVENDIGESRLEEIETVHWKALIDRGAKIVRCGGIGNSPKDVLHEVLSDRCVVDSPADEFIETKLEKT